MTDSAIKGTGVTCREQGVVERVAQHAGAALRPGLIRTVLSRALEVALWVATAGRGLRSVLPRGEVVRLAPRYRRTYWNVEEYEAFRVAIRPGETVIDAGANTGAYTVLFAQWVGPAGHVYAFEPVPRVARALRAQLALNGVSEQVTVVEAALGHRTGHVTMIAPGTVGINRRALPTDGPHDRVKVAIVRLDDFCAERHINPGLLKIDVEGAELDVLRGARRVLASSPRPRIFVEFHPSLWSGYGVTPAALRQELSDQGLRAESLRPSDDVWHIEGICARVVPA